MGLLYFRRTTNHGDFNDCQELFNWCNHQYLYHKCLHRFEQWNSEVRATFLILLLFNGIRSRSIKGLQDWLFYASYATQARYASAFLNRQVFLSSALHEPLAYDATHNCTNMNLIETSVLNGVASPYCRYASGQAYLSERYTREPSDVIFSAILDFDLNLAITFAFTLGMILFNLFLYLIPLPAFVKAKFRE